MKRTIEKIKAIYHIIIGKEYAVYVIGGKSKGYRPTACLISDNSSYLFLRTIIKYTTSYLNDKSGVEEKEESK